MLLLMVVQIRLLNDWLVHKCKKSLQNVVIKADTHEGACSRNTLPEQICSWSLLPHI